MLRATVYLCCLMFALQALPCVAGENLVKNGDFNTADPADSSSPQFWQKPDGLGVRWIAKPGFADKSDKAICMDTRVTETKMIEQWKKLGMDEWLFDDAVNDPIARTYGLSFYSVKIPVEKGQAYRLTFDFKGNVGGIGQSKVWVRGYAQLRGRERRIWETIANPYPVNGKHQQWRRVSQVFYPTKLAKKVIEMKVMLYGCYPPGLFWFDNIKIEKISQEEYKKGREDGALIVPLPTGK